MVKVRAVMGITRLRPPMWRMSVCSAPCITLPAPRNKQGLGKAMGHEVEHRGGYAEGTQRQHHQPEVADGGVGEDALEVGGDESDGGSHQGGEEADAGDGLQGSGMGRLEYGEGPGHEEDSGHHHGGGVNQGTDRTGALHGIREAIRGRGTGPTCPWPQGRGAGRCRSVRLRLWPRHWRPPRRCGCRSQRWRRGGCPPHVPARGCPPAAPRRPSGW